MITPSNLSPCSNFGNLCQPLVATLAGSLHRFPGGVYIPLCMYRCNAAYGLPTKSEQATYVLPTTLSLGRQSYGSATGTAVSMKRGPTPTLEAATRLRGAQAEVPPAHTTSICEAPAGASLPLPLTFFATALLPPAFLTTPGCCGGGAINSGVTSAEAVGTLMD